MLWFVILLAGFQETPIQEQIKVRLVLLDVSVFDKDGAPVTDLTADDFIVKDQRKQVDTTFFDVYDIREPFDYASSVAAPNDGYLAPDPIAVNLPKILIVFDFEPLRNERARTLFADVKQFLSKLGMEHRYRVSLFTQEKRFLTDGYVIWSEALRQLQDYEKQFFEHREKQQNPYMEKKLQYDIGIGGSIGVTDDPAKFSGPVENIGQLIDAIRRCQRGIGQTRKVRFGPCGCEGLVSYFLAMQKERSENLVRDLENVATMLDGKDKINMFLLTPGFLDGDIPGLKKVAAYFKGSLTCWNSIGAREARVNLLADWGRVYRLCAEKRIVFHTFDIDNSAFTMPRGPNESSDVFLLQRGLADYEWDQTLPMKKMAKETGGDFVTIDDMDGAFERVLARHRFHYIIGYNAPKDKKDKYHKVKVQLQRKGLTLHYRKGYYYRW